MMSPKQARCLPSNCWWATLLALAGMLLVVCPPIGVADTAHPAPQGWAWQLPPGFLPPWVPPQNFMTAAKVELGRHLFYDVRLSGNRTQSCASCHQQERAFTDGKARGEGSTGELHPRGAMSLLNVAYVPRLTWAHPHLDLLEEQALVPLLGTAPIEMGLAGQEPRFLAEAAADARYVALAAKAFPDGAAPPGTLTLQQVTQALAAFQRSLLSFRSPYDRYRFLDQPDAISPAAKRGEILFFSGEKAGCFQCHGGTLFAGALRTAARPEETATFHNTGLYNLVGEDPYPAPNRGVFEHTGNRQDIGKFRAPTLRNVAVTAPYMHDGSIATLREVLDHYIAGGRTIHTGPLAGVGSRNPNKSPAIRPLSLTAAEKHDLLAFLESLTDHEALADPRWRNPWPKGSPANP
jgi:cytochrome c peroxidase